MKFVVTFKSPDAIHDATVGLSDERRAQLAKVASKWIEYGEYLSVVIDTDKGTCTVLEND